MQTRGNDTHTKFKLKYDIYDLYINGKKQKRLYGVKKALAQAEKSAGGLWGRKLVELVDIKTGEVIYSTIF